MLADGLAPMSADVRSGDVEQEVLPVLAAALNHGGGRG